MNQTLPQAIVAIARHQRELRAMVADNVVTIPDTIHVLSNADHGKKLVFTNDNPNSLLIPAGLSTSLDVTVLQAGQGKIRVLETDITVVVENYNGHNQTSGRLAEMRILAYQQNHVVTSGQMSTAAN